MKNREWNRQSKTPRARDSSAAKAKAKAPETADFLLEIGTEELPWQVVQPALSHLTRAFERFLEQERIGHGGIRPLGTMRRLAIVGESLSLRQSSVRQESLGPPKSVSFDASGRPTQAASGFAKSQGVAVEALQIRETPKGSYVCAVKEEPGRPTEDVLAAGLPSLIQQISFPRAMRWNETGIRFARPIRWLVVLLGSKILPVSVAGVQSGCCSFGYRFLKRQFFSSTVIRAPRAYVADLKKVHVWVDPQERRSQLEREISDLARSVKGHVYRQHADELLDQAVNTVEAPHALMGSFAARYLEMPKDVLITSMKEHQGFFSIVDSKGQLLPRFIAATNMKLADMSVMRKGNERVLAARLADAQYFFTEDRKRKLVERLESLKGVVFHQKLGTLFQKTERMVSLASLLAEHSGFSTEKESCQRAALLSKADLTTGMVGEFPTLQGIMGREYARHDGEADTVCLAIGEHYLPRAPDDAIPHTRAGQLLSLADRLDTLGAFFEIGLVPSGSEDPLGLRRQAFGAVRILIEGKLSVNLLPVFLHTRQQLVTQGLAPSSSQPGESDVTPGIKALVEFLGERLKFYGRTTPHHLRDDVMEAVLAGRAPMSFDVLDLFLRIQALQILTGQADFEPLIVGFKRAHRLVEKEQWASTTVDPGLFSHPSEHRLYQELEQTHVQLAEHWRRKAYDEGLRALIALKPGIDGFFEGVLINAPEAPVRANRLSLLKKVKDTFGWYADFSRIQVQGSEARL